MAKYKDLESGEKPDPIEKLFKDTREIHLTCEDAYWRVYGWPKITKLIASVWETASEKVNYEQGALVSLTITDMSLRSSICPFRIVEFVYQQPRQNFKATYKPNPKYSSVPLRLYVIPNDEFFKVDTIKDEPKPTSEITL